MKKGEVPDGWKVLVVGNNPIELGPVFDRLRQMPGKRVLTETAFDMRSILSRLISFRPQHILIDDNIGRNELHAMLKRLQKKLAPQVPITVLKNSNYQETAASGVMNYVLKKDLTGEQLYRELLNSLHFLKTQQFWAKACRKQRTRLGRFLSLIGTRLDFPTRLS